MKTYMFAALAAVPGIVSVVSAITVEETIASFEKQLALVKEAAMVLESAKDKASADTAAAQIDKIVNKMRKNQRELKALGELTPEQKSEAEMIITSRKEELVAAVMPFAIQVMRLTGADFFGSADLKCVMEKVAEVAGTAEAPTAPEMN